MAIKFPYSAEYPGGKSALLDGLTGSDQFFDGHWQGYLGVETSVCRVCRVRRVIFDLANWRNLI